ncbi:MAG: nucleotidyltransferase substrate binding protein [Coxiellaceae bacterium]|nr:nucleotidyltransferase substrate binding protein [Coxiellaceae bacterium]
MKTLILDPLEKALNSLQKALEEPKDEFIRDATIQRFEYSFKPHKARNLTTHTYNEDTAEETYLVAVNFLPEAQYLLEKLKEKVSGH